MAESSLPAPSVFLASPGEPAVPWKRWVENFKIYLTASGLNTVAADRKRAILFHCLGTEGQRLAQSLEQIDTYDNAVTALENYFGPKKSVMMERYIFRQRAQKPGENIQQFTTAELASTCNFGVLQTELVRDQLIEKTCYPRIRERLLMEPLICCSEK